MRSDLKGEWQERLYSAITLGAGSYEIEEFVREQEFCDVRQLNAWLTGANKPTTISLIAIGAITGVPWRWIASGCSIRQISGYERLPYRVVTALLDLEKREQLGGAA